MRIATLASSAALALLLVGCGTMPKAPVAKVETQASRHEKLARAAVTSGDLVAALGHAERAVAASPQDLGYRMLLGDLYLKNGRLRSADAAFRDVLHLAPDNARAIFSLALAEIAAGKRHGALSRLEQLADSASAADLGLAFALAGDAPRAVAMLEEAARLPGASVRVRQNLALAHALAGDWHRARLIAEMDLAPADVPGRMAEWAAFAQPRSPADQVASLFGVAVADDPGQPLHLALAPVSADPLPTDAPVMIAEAEPVPFPVERVPFPVEPVVAAVTQPIEAAPAPRRIAKPVPTRFVVQLGAYASARNMRQGWSQLRRRYTLAGTPHGAAVSVAGKGKVHRLSVGYSTQAEALRACQAIKRKRGGCFVRAAAGDRPIQV